jgi:hypothetical protein
MPDGQPSSRQSLAEATRKGGSIGWADMLDRRGDALVKFAAWITRSLQANMRAELGDIERAASNGTREPAAGSRPSCAGRLRAQSSASASATAGATSTIRTGKSTPRPLVYTKAPQIIRAFDEGALIRSKRGRFLAIPTENAPRKATDGKRISPSTFPEHRLGPLRFVPRPSGPSLLVADGLRASHSRQTGQLRGFRRATDRARHSGQGLVTVVMFLLMPQVKLPKRLDVARAAERWSAQLPALIEQHLQAE